MEIKFIAAVCVFTSLACTGCYRSRIYNQNNINNPQSYNNYNTAPTVPISADDYSNEYELKAKDGTVYRPNGSLDDKDLTWVVEFEGEIVFQGNAIDKFVLDPTWCGIGHHRIWLESNLSEKPVSNIIEWQQSIAEVETDADDVVLKAVENTKYINTYKIAAKNGIVKRPNGIYDENSNLGWTVELNNVVVLEANAQDNFEINPMWRGDGHYRVWLTAFLDGGYKRVSNKVEFDVPLIGSEQDDSGDFDNIMPIENTQHINTYKLTAEDGLVTRSKGQYDEGSLTWVITVNGETKLQRNAEGEMSYRPLGYGDGKYEVWLNAFVDGGYKRVSNKVSWDMPLEMTAEDAGITRLKSEMKTLIRELSDENAVYEYKKGFVIDPDHDGSYDSCAFYAGKDKNGTEAQFILENGVGSKLYTTECQRDKCGPDTKYIYLYIWCDEISGKDYIVRCETDKHGNVTASDCCTNEIIYTIKNDELMLFGQKTQDKSVIDNGRYFFRSSAPCDKDQFVVSKNGRTELQGA